MKEFKRKLHDDGIPMKIETIYGNDNKEVVKSVNGLIYRTKLKAISLDIITCELSPALNAWFDDWS